MFNKAVKDCLVGLCKYELWIYLSWQEVRQRYRRSMLGPLWITLSMAVFVSIIGPLYSRLFNQNLNDYLLGLSLGFVAWNYISLTINDFSQALINSEKFILQIKLPYSIYIYKTILRNLIIFFHNLIVVIAVYFLFPAKDPGNWLFFVSGLIILSLNLVWIGIFISLICTRFRDLNQLLANVIQISFFLTPIIWYPKALGTKSWILEYNIFYHFVELVRSPLVYPSAYLHHLQISFSILVAGTFFSLFFYNKYINRISYWI